MKRARTSERSTQSRADDERASVRSADRSGGAGPASQLQRRVGNQGLQRLARRERADDAPPAGRADERTDGHANSCESPAGRVRGPPDGSTGRPLAGPTRRPMERALGADFGDVRIHDGVGATAVTRRLDAAAYATDGDVVLRSDPAVDTVDAGLVLAHELAHVAQYARADGATPSDSGPTRRRDPAEREAASAAARALGGEQTSVRETPAGPVATVGLGWLRDGYDTVTSGVASAASATNDAYWGTVDAAADTMVEHGGPVGAVQAGMERNAQLIRQGDEAVDSGIDTVQDFVADTAWSAAEATEGIPGIEQLAKGGAWSVDQYTGLAAGANQGLTTMGADLLGMAANPVGTARGIESILATTPVMGTPIRLGRAARQSLTGESEPGQAFARALSPRARMREAGQLGMGIASTIVEDYRRSIGEDGDYSQAIGRLGFDVLTTIGTGGLGAGSKTSKAAKAGRVGDTASDLSSAGRVGRGSLLSNLWERLSGGRAGRTVDDAPSRAGTALEDTVEISGRSGVDQHARITSSGSEAMTTQRAMDRTTPVKAGEYFDWGGIVDDIGFSQKAGPEAAAATNRWERIDAAVADAERAGLMKPGGKPGTVDAAFFPYKRAPQMREALGKSGDELQGAHLNPDAAMKRLDVSWNKGEGLSMGLDSFRHNQVMDAHWKDFAQSMRYSGHSTVPATMWRQKLWESVEQVGGVERRTKDAMQSAIFHELHAKHGLDAFDDVVLPYPNIGP